MVSSMRNYILTLLIGLLIGAAGMWKFGQHTAHTLKVSDQTNVSAQQTQTTIVSKKETKPDGTRVNTSVTTITKNEQEKQRVVSKTPEKRPDDKATARWTLGLSFTPLSSEEMKLQGLQPSGVSLGRRVGDIPLWTEVEYNWRNGTITLGIRLGL